MISRLESAKYYSHSLPGEPRTGMISRLELQSKASQPLTNWRAKGRHDQQAKFSARHHSHSLPGEARTGMISKLELQQSTTATHKLESQGEA